MRHIFTISAVMIRRSLRRRHFCNADRTYRAVNSHLYDASRVGSDQRLDCDASVYVSDGCG